MNGTRLDSVGNGFTGGSASGFSTMSSTPNQPRSLIIAPGTLIGGYQYVFGVSIAAHAAVTGIDVAELTTLRSNVTLDVNDTPSVGTAVISPTEGYARETLFQLTMRDFSDSDPPLTYILSVRNPAGTFLVCACFTVIDFRLSQPTDVNADASSTYHVIENG